MQTYVQKSTANFLLFSGNLVSSRRKMHLTSPPIEDIPRVQRILFYNKIWKKVNSTSPPTEILYNVKSAKDISTNWKSLFRFIPILARCILFLLFVLGLHIELRDIWVLGAFFWPRPLSRTKKISHFSPGNLISNLEDKQCVLNTG